MEKNILIKIHKSYRWVVAICDEELYGKLFTEGERQLDLTGNFFKGESMNEKKIRLEIIRCLREDANFNVVGDRSVGIIKKLGLAKESDIIKIDSVPFILLLI
ncbi:MAG: DUF424 family protein [Candidatus Pacearchaeota archaeon]